MTHGSVISSESASYSLEKYLCLTLGDNDSGFVLLLALKSRISGDLSVLDKLGWLVTLERMDPKQL